MATVFDVAAYILGKKGEMTAWKLQKLVYYSQAWSLVWDLRPLFAERIEAWPNGPVCPDLYRVHAGQLWLKAFRLARRMRLTPLLARPSTPCSTSMATCIPKSWPT
jgi:hypothetical protein